MGSFDEITVAARAIIKLPQTKARALKEKRTKGEAEGERKGER